MLKEWLRENKNTPYPTDQEKELLKQQTGLTICQISNWFSNARRRGKYGARGGPSPALGSPSAAIDIPHSAQKSWDLMDPLERWKHSPPEHEPATIPAIVEAVAISDLPQTDFILDENLNLEPCISTGSSLSLAQAPSSSSFGTRHSTKSNGSHESSSRSHDSRNSISSAGSLPSSQQYRRRRRRRVQNQPARSSLINCKRPFKCTFCTDSFKSKYDWMRHEKTLHLSAEKWICAPLGPVTTCSASGVKQCVYCEEKQPSKDHIEAHNHIDCEERGIQARTFYRKDHLTQHLRLIHSCRFVESMNSWRLSLPSIRSRCGICWDKFTTWSGRADNLAKHFHNGATVSGQKD